MQTSNFHTHTTFSDGHDNVEEMIEHAISIGFTAIGFSDHSYYPMADDWCMTETAMRENHRAITAAKEKYRDQIRVYCGIELDGESTRPETWPDRYDYILSSVHSIVRRGVILPIDESGAKQCEIVHELCGGDWMDFAKAYYASLTEHIATNKTDIVGHFDLVTKYSLMPEDADAYRAYATAALCEIARYCKTFELNTGAIARGLRTVPYPADFLLDEIRACGGRVIITSDCHYKDKLTVWFDEAEALLTAHGFTKNPHADLNDIVRDIEIWE